MFSYTGGKVSSVSDGITGAMNNSYDQSILGLVASYS
jgi:hypothetical protein